jgi:hypothetical protein
MVAVGRILMMFVAYTLACVAASLVLTIGSLTPEWNDFAASLGMQSPAAQSAALWAIVAIGAVIIFAVGMLPTLIVIALAEGFALRSIVLYGVVGGALALAMGYGLDFAGYVAPPGSDLAREREVFAAAGIAGGFVYWLFAGRRAGVWK